MNGWMDGGRGYKCSQGFVIKACLLWSLEDKEQSPVDSLIVRLILAQFKVFV